MEPEFWDGPVYLIVLLVLVGVWTALANRAERIAGGEDHDEDDEGKEKDVG